MATREPDHNRSTERAPDAAHAAGAGAMITAEPEVEQRIKRAKTSAAAATALAIGSAAFVLTLLVLFFPVALILGVIGLLLGIVCSTSTSPSPDPARTGSSAVVTDP